MNHRSILLSGLAALALAGCASRSAEPEALTSEQQRQLAAELKDRVAGTPQSCIPYRPGMRTTRISDSVLLYDNGPIVYRNDLSTRCPGFARRQDAMVMDVRGNNLCSGETFRLVDTGAGFPTAICQLGDFTPYRRVGG